MHRQFLLPIKHRLAFAKLRMGVAPLNIEIGRYTNLAIEVRLCPFCLNITEDETHVMLYCGLHDDIRAQLFKKACDLNPNFNMLANDDQMRFLFSNNELIRVCAKTCYDILQKRSFCLYRH